MAKENKKTQAANKDRLTIFNYTTLKEIATFKFTKYNIFTFSGIVVILISIIVGVLLVYSPLNIQLNLYL